MDLNHLLRAIPKVDVLMELAAAEPELRDLSGGALLAAIRRTLEEVRSQLLNGELTTVPAREGLFRRIGEQAEVDRLHSLRPVINATGVVLHTNLGRATLGAAVAKHVAEVAASYSTLEYNPVEGARGSRHVHLEKLLTRLTGCEAALAVNNNAAAVMLIMSALFNGREVIVSRGELVEIGGAFRIPDIMELGGVTLRAVGTTNKTRLSDYAKAVAPGKTGGFLKVHTSNFRIIGYTEQPDLDELAALAHQHDLPFIFDLGGGAFMDLQPLGIQDEPTVQQVLRAGADLICFSGDKLLGGAQAGLIIGRRDLIVQLKSHPMARALRVDKMTLAALEATLKLHLDPDEARRQIPTLAMLFAEPSELRQKAEVLRRVISEAVPSLGLEVTPTESQTGGGAAPEKPLPSWAVSVKSDHLSEADLEERLRRGKPPVVVRTGQNRIWLDVRTIQRQDFAVLAGALKTALDG